MFEPTVTQRGCEKQFYLSRSCCNAAATNSFLWAADDATSPWWTILSEAAVTQRSCEKQFYLSWPWCNAAVRHCFIWGGRDDVTRTSTHLPCCPLPFPSFPLPLSLSLPFSLHHPFPDFTCFTSLTSPSLPSPSLPSLPGMGRGRSSVEALENWWVDGLQARDCPWYLKKWIFWKPNPAFKFHFMVTLWFTLWS